MECRRGRKISAKCGDHRSLGIWLSRRSDSGSIRLDLCRPIQDFRIAVADCDGTVEEEPVQRSDVIRRECAIIGRKFGFNFLDDTRVVYAKAWLAMVICMTGHGDLARRRALNVHSSFTSWRRASIEG